MNKKLAGVLEQLHELRAENQSLRALKVKESEQHMQYIRNCMSILGLYQQKRSDCTLENLIVFSETVSAIATDIQGFKTIRSRLFAHASQDQGEGKLYLYLFHLFESLVANVSTLISKTQSQLVA